MNHIISDLKFLLLLLSAATAETDVSICPSNLLRTKFLRQNESSCYEFVLNHHGYWANADRDCKRRNGHLVTIGSATEQAFIFNSLKVSTCIKSTISLTATMQYTANFACCNND